MKSKIVTPTAEALVRHVAEYIYERNVSAGDQYSRAVMQTFFQFDERFLPRRASEHLPEYVRELNVIGFKGYTIRVAVLDDKIALVAAFAPGLSDRRKNARSKAGLRDADDE